MWQNGKNHTLTNFSPFLWISFFCWRKKHINSKIPNFFSAKCSKIPKFVIKNKYNLDWSDNFGMTSFHCHETIPGDRKALGDCMILWVFTPNMPNVFVFYAKKKWDIWILHEKTLSLSPQNFI